MQYDLLSTVLAAARRQCEGKVQEARMAAVVTSPVTGLKPASGNGA